MKSTTDTKIIGDVIDAMAAKAIETARGVNQAIELFSAGVDRLLAWLPEDSRRETLYTARSHGYCTPVQIEKMRHEARRHD